MLFFLSHFCDEILNMNSRYMLLKVQEFKWHYYNQLYVIHVKVLSINMSVIFMSKLPSLFSIVHTHTYCIHFQSLPLCFLT
jgi:hypothetical protein